MTLKEHVSLAPHTTLGVGGEARFFIDAQNEKDIEDAIAFARAQSLPLFILGRGSNLLVPDEGIEGVVIKMALHDTKVEDEEESIVLTAGAGALWEDIVNHAATRNAFGIESLAGIPGSLGGAVVQNIGAYGTELSTVFEYADTIDGATGTFRRFTSSDASFAYRTSYFKAHPEIIIMYVALRLPKEATPNLFYPDLMRAQTAGTPLATPTDIAKAVRAIRAQKFPEKGCAGSFFKNPIVSAALGQSLAKRFPGLPVFPQRNGEVKVSLAWVLDHVLHLKGFSKGPVRLYEKQPLVIVASDGACAADVDAFAEEIAQRVFDATGIRIEREVETFGTRTT